MKNNFRFYVLRYTLRMLAAIMLAITSAANAGQFEDGLAAYDRKDYAAALKLFQPLAKQGNVHAQTNLGAMYANGHGVPQDYAEAMKWYSFAAKQNNPLALFSVGQLHFYGRGVPKNQVEAMKWWRQAADRGYAFAQFNLGLSYAKGVGVEKDMIEAHKWIALAGTRGHERSAETVSILEKSMKPEQITEAKKRAAAWKLLK